MTTRARMFLVGSIVLVGTTVFGVNYYVGEEKHRKRSSILLNITKRDEQRRANMDQYEKQLKLDEQLRQRDQ